MAFAPASGSLSRPGSLRDLHLPHEALERDRASDTTAAGCYYGTFPALTRRSGDELAISGWYVKWDQATNRIAEIATLPFLFMQVPQIILDTRNLLKGDYAALFAVEWKAQLASLAGNLSLMSYFVHKRERGATFVQAVGVLTTLVVLIQLAIASAMPLIVLMITILACLTGFLVSGLHYVSFLKEEIWKTWQDIISIVGIFVLTQIIWSTFDLFLPSSIIPGIIAVCIIVVLIVLERFGNLPYPLMSLMGNVFGWTATLLFMWSPVSQLYTNLLDPSNIGGLSVYTILLALIGNAMLMARALFIRDLMWFVGATWGCLVQGWTILLTMFIYGATNGWIFGITTSVLICWLGIVCVNNQKAYLLRWPWSGVTEVFRRRS